MEEIGQDVISKLPDNLIHEILSFVDMKYAVQTSVLSKRWGKTWVSLPYLNFTWSDFIAGKDININDPVNRSKQIERFVDFVCMVLMLRDTSDIQKLEVHPDWTTHMSDHEYSRNLNRWIVAAVGRNVKELSIGINHDPAYELPHPLLHCKTLRELLVYGCNGTKYTNIVLPKSIGLPQLTQLVLFGVSISNAELTQRLFTSSPLLELLAMVNCDLLSDNLPNSIVDSLSLVRFVYYGKHLRLENYTRANTIKLSAPNLRIFCCRDFLTREYYLEKFPSVGIAWFKLILKEYVKDETTETYSKLPAEEKKVYAKRVMKFLQAVPNVRRLTLSPGFLEVLSHAPDLLEFGFLQFCKLQCLELDIWLTRGCLRSIAYLLRISPNLKSILLTSKESNLANVGDDWEAGMASPSLLSHLESVVINEVEGCDNEIKFLGFLLENAKVLKNLRLVTRSTVGSPDRARQVNRIRDALTALATANSHIKVSYYLNDVLLT